MRITIERIPATQKVLECFLDEEGIEIVKELTKYNRASVTKVVDDAHVDDAFTAILKAILKLPDAKNQPPIIGFD